MHATASFAGMPPRQHLYSLISIITELMKPKTKPVLLTAVHTLFAFVLPTSNECVISPVAYLNLGIALQSVGRQRDAEDAYRMCSQLDISILKDPKLHESAKITCLFNLGRLLADEHKFQASTLLLVSFALRDSNFL